MAISFQESGDGPSATVDFFAACKMFAASIGARKSPRDFLDSNLFIHRAAAPRERLNTPKERNLRDGRFAE